MNDPIAQIQSYVFDVIRSSVPRLELDDAFASKADVAEAVKNQLSTLMTEYGYTIVDCLITDLEPDPMVKRAMNQINAEQRKREAASYQADAQKILAVKSAEADAESKYLAGLGVARQRKAVVDGKFTSPKSDLIESLHLPPTNGRRYLLNLMNNFCAHSVFNT